MINYHSKHDISKTLFLTDEVSPYLHPVAQANAQYSSAYEDPHFHVLGISDSQPDLCFDLNGNPGGKMVIIKDIQTGFEVVGDLFSPNGKDGVFFSKLTITSPYKVISNK